MGGFGFGVNLNTTGLGLGTGIDVAGTVAQLINAARAPEQVLLQQQSLFKAQVAALTDLNTKLTSLQTAVNALQDPAGQLLARVATSSNTSVLTATASAGATLANHSVTVSALATTSSYSTNTLTDGNTTFGTGQFTIQVGTNAPVNVTVDSTNNTLNTLAASINSNSQTLGVTANVITDASGARLSLVSNTSGAPGDLTVSGNTTGLTFTKNATGTNGSLIVDGVTISNTSNIVTSAIAGVTLNLAGTSASPVTVSVNPDTTQASAAINNFASAYNSVVQAINTQFTYTQGATGQPPLFSDSTLAQVQQTLNADVNTALAAGSNNGFTSLAAIGVNLQQDGTLQVNTSTLNSALSNNFANVQTFFQQSGTGFAVKFGADLTNLTDVINGPLNIDIQGINQSLTTVTDQISSFEDRLSIQQQTLFQQFSQVNATLQQLPLIISQITNQLNSLTSGH